MVTRIDGGLPYNGWRSRGCSGQLIGGTARLTGKMTCGGSGPGAVRLTKRPRLSRGGVIGRSP